MSSTVFSKILTPLGTFFKSKRNRRFLYIIIICLFALGDYLYSGLARRTFVFYTIIDAGGINDAGIVVEERFLHNSGDRETDIRRYVEEALLGPKSRDLALLLTRGTRVDSFMYRDGVVFVNLTDQAALPPPEGGTVFGSLLVLNKGIRRNFSFVQDVRIFIGGNQVFFEEFRGIFANSADNSKT